METNKIYHCSYESGSGTHYDEGIWQIVCLTEITLIVEKITENTVYGFYEKGDIIKCGRIKQNGNTLRCFKDGTFVIYPNQNGTPFYFENCIQIKNIKLVKESQLTLF